MNNLGFITYRCRLVHDIYLCYIYNIDLFVVVILIMMVWYEYSRFGLHLYICLFVINGVPYTTIIQNHENQYRIYIFYKEIIPTRTYNIQSWWGHFATKTLIIECLWVLSVHGSMLMFLYDALFGTLDWYKKSNSVLTPKFVLRVRFHIA